MQNRDALAERTVTQTGTLSTLTFLLLRRLVGVDLSLFRLIVPDVAIEDLQGRRTNGRTETAHRVHRYLEREIRGDMTWKAQNGTSNIERGQGFGAGRCGPTALAGNKNEGERGSPSAAVNGLLTAGWC